MAGFNTIFLEFGSGILFWATLTTYTDHTCAECREIWWLRADSGCRTWQCWRRHYIDDGRRTGERLSAGHSSDDILPHTHTMLNVAAPAEVSK